MLSPMTVLELIEKSIKIWDDSIEIRRGENMLTLTQMAQGKEAREKLVQKVKKLGRTGRRS